MTPSQGDRAHLACSPCPLFQDTGDPQAAETSWSSQPWAPQPWAPQPWAPQPVSLPGICPNRLAGHRPSVLQQTPESPRLHCSVETPDQPPGSSEPKIRVCTTHTRSAVAAVFMPHSGQPGLGLSRHSRPGLRHCTSRAGDGTDTPIQGPLPEAHN